jgi:hypothetical protein
MERGEQFTIEAKEPSSLQEAALFGRRRSAL